MGLPTAHSVKPVVVRKCIVIANGVKQSKYKKEPAISGKPFATQFFLFLYKYYLVISLFPGTKKYSPTSDKKAYPNFSMKDSGRFPKNLVVSYNQGL